MNTSHKPFSHPQIPLGFQPGELYSFDSLVSGQNNVLIDSARQLVSNKGEKQLFVWGQQGTGKSHLLQACCNFMARNNGTVCYFTANEIRQYAPEMFDGLHQLDLVCLDELDKWLDDSQWEFALFDLINRMREAGNSLVLASSSAPDDSGISLPDLRSRLSWGPVFQIHELDDQGKNQALRIRARQSGLELPESVAAYMVQRYPRDMKGLFDRLAALDRAAMASQRRLTIPLVRSVFAD